MCPFPQEDSEGHSSIYIYIFSDTLISAQFLCYQERSGLPKMDLQICSKAKRSGHTRTLHKEQHWAARVTPVISHRTLTLLLPCLEEVKCSVCTFQHTFPWVGDAIWVDGSLQEQNILRRGCSKSRPNTRSYKTCSRNGSPTVLYPVLKTPGKRLVQWDHDICKDIEKIISKSFRSFLVSAWKKS